MLTVFRSKEPQWALTAWWEPSSRTMGMIARGKAAYEQEQARRLRYAKYEGKRWFGVRFLDEFGLMADDHDAESVRHSRMSRSNGDDDCDGVNVELYVKMRAF